MLRLLRVGNKYICPRWLERKGTAAIVGIESIISRRVKATSVFGAFAPPISPPNHTCPGNSVPKYLRYLAQAGIHLTVWAGAPAVHNSTAYHGTKPDI